MQRLSRFSSISLASLLVFAGFAVLAACGEQGEGEPCDLNNGDEDCSPGLYCKPAAATGSFRDRCCPQVGGPQLCINTTAPVGGGDGNSPVENDAGDAGNGGDASGDAPSDVGPDGADAADGADGG